MNLLKIFLLNIFIIVICANISFAKEEIYRSNSNGLMLIKINPNETKKYKYILKVNIADDLIIKKYLYKNNTEIKRWNYSYSNKILIHEKYYKDREIKEEYYYDTEGHKNRQIEYKNRNKIKETSYKYNKDGLVDTENIKNLLSGQSIYVKYRYDSKFRIKQIEKLFPDGRIVYWEVFFTARGIITKEFYTLKNEKFIFWYNEYGQEMKGEVKEIDENFEESLKKEWKVFYTKEGRINKREEQNYKENNFVRTWYNKNYKERKIEVYEGKELISIENFKYNKNNKITNHEIIQGLESKKTYYEYDEKDNVVKTKHYENDKLKKVVQYNEDKSRIEILYGENNKKIIVEYDSKGKMINQQTVEEENN